MKFLSKVFIFLFVFHTFYAFQVLARDSTSINDTPQIVERESIQDNMNYQSQSESFFPWWMWLILLFMVSFFIGIVAVLGGVGGGVLFVPIVGSFFPFHMDFVRATGLLLAMAGALSSIPDLFRKGISNIRASMLFAFVASIASIIGAIVGILVPENIIQVLLGIIILCILLVIFFVESADYPQVQKTDKLARMFEIHGCYFDESIGKEITWNAHNTLISIFMFLIIGFIGGMFGLGAGWANVPVLNIISGFPLKVSVATSSFILLTSSTTASWIYINKGALLPIIAVPSIIGVMLGAKLGVELLKKLKSKNIKKIVMILLLIAGIRALLKGLLIWI